MINKLKGILSAMIAAVTVSSADAQSTLNVKAFIDSYYIDTLQQMVPVIDRLNEPSLFDTIEVDLKDVNSGVTAFSQKVVFNVDGNGSVILSPIFSGHYFYLVLHHRNSIETSSQFPLFITDTVNYDFTTAVSQAFGDNQKWKTNAACIYNGDLNQDGVIDTLDFNIYDADNLNLASGYLVTDLNGDGFVDIGDFPYFEQNFILGITAILPVFTVVNEINGKADILFYPNPASTSLFIEKWNDENEKVLYIYSYSSQLIQSMKLNGNNINISELAIGSYMIILKSGDKIYRQKFIKN